MDLQLTDKVALVTGGSEGIGKGIARALAREGCDVAICARRPDVLDKSAGDIRAESGRRVVAIPADLTRRELVVLVPLVVGIVWLGLFPGPVLRRMEPASQRFVEAVQGAGVASAPGDVRLLGRGPNR